MVSRIELSVEAMLRRRRAILLAGLTYGGAWQITRIIEDFTRDSRLLSSVWVMVLLLVQFVGYIGWIVSLFQFFTYTKRLKQNPAIAEAVADEFYQQIWLKALVFACAGALFCQCLLIAVSPFHPLTAQVGADITLFVVCTTAIAAFLWMERNS